MYSVRVAELFLQIEPVWVKLLTHVYGRERLSLAERSDGGEGKADSGEVFLYSPLKVVIFVALMCGMLVLMYFFYHVLGKWRS